MGCTLYCLVVGRLPFTSDFLPDLFASINNDTYAFPLTASTLTCQS